MSRKIILVYHEIKNNRSHDNYLNTPISCFIQQVNYLLESGLTPCHLEILLKNNKDGFLITIDDGLAGSWDGICFLEKNNIPYGLALIASKIGQPGFLTIHQLNSLQFAEFYSHSLTHSIPNTVDEVSFLKEVIDSKVILQKILKKEIKTYVYPYGEYRVYNLNVLKQHYQFGLSLLPFHLNFLKYNEYYLPRLNIHGGYSFQKFKFLVSYLGSLYLQFAYLKRKFLGQSYLSP